MEPPDDCPICSFPMLCAPETCPKFTCESHADVDEQFPGHETVGLETCEFDTLRDALRRQFPDILSQPTLEEGPGGETGTDRSTVILQCGHQMHAHCLYQYVGKNSQGNVCPICRQPIFPERTDEQIAIGRNVRSEWGDDVVQAEYGENPREQRDFSSYDWREGQVDFWMPPNSSWVLESTWLTKRTGPCGVFLHRGSNVRAVILPDNEQFNTEFMSRLNDEMNGAVSNMLVIARKFHMQIAPRYLCSRSGSRTDPTLQYVNSLNGVHSKYMITATSCRSDVQTEFERHASARELGVSMSLNGAEITVDFFPDEGDVISSTQNDDDQLAIIVAPRHNSLNPGIPGTQLTERGYRPAPHMQSRLVTGIDVEFTWHGPADFWTKSSGDWRLETLWTPPRTGAGTCGVFTHPDGFKALILTDPEHATPAFFTNLASKLGDELNGMLVIARMPYDVDPPQILKAIFGEPGEEEDHGRDYIDTDTDPYAIFALTPFFFQDNIERIRKYGLELASNDDVKFVVDFLDDDQVAGEAIDDFQHEGASVIVAPQYLAHSSPIAVQMRAQGYRPTPLEDVRVRNLSRSKRSIETIDRNDRSKRSKRVTIETIDRNDRNGSRSTQSAGARRSRDSAKSAQLVLRENRRDDVSMLASMICSTVLLTGALAVFTNMRT